MAMRMMMVQVLVKGEGGRPKMENEHPQQQRHEHERGQPSMRRMDDATKMGGCGSSCRRYLSLAQAEDATVSLSKLRVVSGRRGEGLRS